MSGTQVAVIGVDPGVSGAWSRIVDTGDGLVLTIVDMPSTKVGGKKRSKTAIDAAQLAGQWRAMAAESKVVVVIEKVGPRPGQGVVSSFSFGHGFGVLLGICAALRLPVALVEPRRWKVDMGLPTGAVKGASREMASRLFPAAASALTRVKDHGRAEALLIAEWGRRNVVGGRPWSEIAAPTVLGGPFGDLQEAEEGAGRVLPALGG